MADCLAANPPYSFTACMLAESLFRTLYTGGFSRFVTYPTALVATGRSESYRTGFAPVEKQRLFTAHDNVELALYFICL